MKLHKVEKRVKGNYMTQKYYVERLFPIYVKAVQNERLRTQNQVYLQENSDPSHGIWKEGLATQLKEANWVINIKHPAQSPDLNPIEGIWNMIKQRVRKRHFFSDEEVKQAL